MKVPKRLIALFFGGAACFVLVAPQAAASSGAATSNSPVESIPGAWQHHKVQFDYFGVTTLYTCDGLEAQVSRILQFLGARRDLRVQARGCLRGPDAPNRQATVSADFYTLAPAPDATAAGTVQAQWSPLELIARRPSFMSEGDCELMEDIKPLIARNFNSRGLDYRTDCTPGQIDIASYGVRGEFLRMILPKTR